MTRLSPSALLASALALAACQQTPSADEKPDAGTASEIAPPDEVLASPNPTPTSDGRNPIAEKPLAGENDGYPDLTPPPVAGNPEKTEAGARAVLLSWARGIELREFDQSWAMMGEAARKQVSKATFNGWLQPLRDISVAVPDGTMEGAAGSSYYTVPVSVSGTRADGSEATLKGDVVMRRVNDVPGATRAQLTWHIERVNLKPA